MLSALDENGELVSLLDGVPAHQNFVCPACHSAVHLKNGKVMRPHFAHVSLDKCDFYSENESSEHLQLKAALYHAVSQTEQVVVEKVLPDLHQVADLFVNDNLALEVQCSRLSEQRFFNAQKPIKVMVFKYFGCWGKSCGLAIVYPLCNVIFFIFRRIWAFICGSWMSQNNSFVYTI